MKSIIFLANPSSDSFGGAIAKAYKNKKESEGSKVEIINLYDKKYSQDFLKFESIREMPEDKVKEKIQKKMLKADEYVFIFPVWWGGVPAILKNFFDTNLSSGFAFQYGKGGSVKKLLTGKTAKVFCTCEAPGFIYKIPFFSGISIKSHLSKSILGFCGIKLTGFNLYSQLKKMKKEERISILEKIN